jgi:glycosyltransferase involved in cell wall biosynthesis
MTRRQETGAGVVAIGPLPPPVHGYSLITARMIEGLQRVVTVEAFDLSPGTMARGWRYHGARARRACRALWRLTRAPAQGRTLYLAIAGGVGVLYDIGFAVAARWRGYRVVIHHHAFSYLTRRSLWTAALVAIAGAEALHVCLCSTMARRLGEKYPRVQQKIVLSNVAFVPPQEAASLPSARAGIRLGFLSNLIPEKGFDTAIEVITALRERRVAATLVLAGPALDRATEHLLDEVKVRLGDALDYRGAVHGAAKTAFFADIDVFLFPTRYANEAQPLVVLEALAFGIPVIASARGCIAEDVNGVGIVVPPHNDFVATAVSAISDWVANPSRLRLLSATAREEAAARHRAATDNLDRVIGAIAGTPTGGGSFAQPFQRGSL